MSTIKFPSKGPKVVKGTTTPEETNRNPIIVYPDETLLIPHGPFMVSNIPGLGHFAQLIQGNPNEK